MLSKKWLIFGLLILNIILFQNCSSPYESINKLTDQNSSDLTNSDSPSNTDPDASNTAQNILAFDGLRPLTKIELESSLEKIFPPNIVDENRWIQTERQPFDNLTDNNNYDDKKVNRSESSAQAIAQAILKNKSTLDTIISTDRTQPITYLNKLVNTLLPNVFRGLFNNSDLNDYKAFAHQEYERTKDLNVSIQQVLTALLMDPKFLYRNEVGSKVSNTDFRLSDKEFLNKMTFFITGSGPSIEMINKVEDGYFKDDNNIEDYLNTLLNSESFSKNILRFHADWLGIYQLQNGSSLFSTSAFKETATLIEKVVFNDDSSWFNLFTSKDTYINDELAEIYGLPTQGNNQWRWARHKDNGRAGIIGQASFLSLENDGGEDTNPIKRGYHIQKTFFCGVINPPPSNIDLDMELPPVESGRNCKIDRIAANTLNNSACSSCHVYMEGIGFGLENYDSFGRYITHETNSSECDINTEGIALTPHRSNNQPVNFGSFSTAEGLSDILIKSKEVGLCLSQKIIEFDIGQTISRNSILVNKLNNYFEKNKSLKSLLKYYVLLPEYKMRKN